VKLLNLNIQVW